MKIIENSFERIQKILNKINDKIESIEDINYIITLKFISISILVKNIDNILENQYFFANSISISKNNHKYSYYIKSLIKLIKIKYIK